MKQLQLASLDMRIRMAIGCVGVVMMGWLLVQYAYQPLLRRITVRRTVVQELEQTTTSAKQQIAHMTDAVMERQDAEAQLATAVRRMGTHQSVAPMLEAISARAKEHAVTCVAVQRRVSADDQDVLVIDTATQLRPVPVHLTLTGRYQDVGTFLGWLPQASSMTMVRMLSVHATDADVNGSGTVQADVTLVTYLSHVGGE